MALLTYILLLHFLSYSWAKNCVIDNTPDYITWEKELLNDLKNCENSSPQAQSESIIVNVTFIMQTFIFDNEEKVIKSQTRMSIKWKDERLKWDPEKYHGINEADGSKIYSVWTPIFGLLDSKDFLAIHLKFLHYVLKSTGHVHGKHILQQEVWCQVKLTNWPYDMQECSYEIVAKESSLETGNYTINYDFVVEEPNSAEWYMYDYKTVAGKRKTKITFFLMREAVGLSAIVIYPAFVLTVLSIVSLCLDVRRKVRFAIICFSLLGHYYFLTELTYNIPKESHFPPTLLLYYRGSVVLSVIITISTFLLGAMCKFKSTPHNFVKLINHFVYENKYRLYLVFPWWEFDDATVDIKPSSEDWVKFANIVNSALIFCVVFAYIGLYGTKIPKRINYDVNINY